MIDFGNMSLNRFVNDIVDSNMVKCLFLILLSVSVGQCVKPHESRTPPASPSRPADCSGVIGFSAKGLGKVHDSGLVGYKTTLINPGGGFFLETGEYTVVCPGFYFVAFASFPQTPSMLTLKKRSASSSGWENLVSTGPNGGSNQVIIQLNDGDQIGVFFSNPPRESTDSSTFSAYRITQK